LNRLRLRVARRTERRLMFEGLRSFVAELLGSEGQRPFAENDYRMAATAILVHLADADGMFGADERRRMRDLVAQWFSLSEAEAESLVAQAALSEAEAVDLDRFAQVLRRALDSDGRLKLVEVMWDLACADGAALEVEDTIVWRVARMLDVSEDELALVRRSRAQGAGE